MPIVCLKLSSGANVPEVRIMERGRFDWRMRIATDAEKHQ